MDECDANAYFLSGVVLAWVVAAIFAITCQHKRLIFKSQQGYSNMNNEVHSIPVCCEARKRLNEAEEDWKGKMTRLQDQLRNENLEKEDALKRLSAIMSSRLRDGNPNVADLNDQNRPTKVGEQFSELYDNQWTDAYGAINNFLGLSVGEFEIIKILREILEHCYTESKVISEGQIDRLNRSVKFIADNVTKKHNRLPTDLMQRIKEERKMFALDEIPSLESILRSLKSKFSSKYQDQSFLDDPIIITFVQECLKLSWLMVIQDPPMAMILKPEADASNNFKPYQTRGNVVSYIVWPALLLKEGGPLIQKGVAEFNSYTSTDSQSNELHAL